MGSGESRTASEVRVIALAGGSACGKSVICRALHAELSPRRVVVVDLDGYHLEDRAQRARSGRLPLDPQMNDLAAAADDVRRLRAGEVVSLPHYDHAVGQLGPARRVGPADVLIVEGLHALYPQFRPHVDLGVYLEVEPPLRRALKVERDVRERGYAAAEVLERIARRAAAHERWVASQAVSADVRVCLVWEGRGSSAPLPSDWARESAVRLAQGDSERLLRASDASRLVHHVAMELLARLEPEGAGATQPAGA